MTQKKGFAFTLTYCLGASTGGLNYGLGTATPGGMK